MSDDVERTAEDEVRLRGGTSDGTAFERAYPADGDTEANATALMQDAITRGLRATGQATRVRTYTGDDGRDWAVYQVPVIPAHLAADVDTLAPSSEGPLLADGVTAPRGRRSTRASVVAPGDPIPES